MQVVGFQFHIAFYREFKLSITTVHRKLLAKLLKRHLAKKM